VAAGEPEVDRTGPPDTRRDRRFGATLPVRGATGGGGPVIVPDLGATGGGGRPRVPDRMPAGGAGMAVA
jgi:hypothetical protein